MKKICFLLFLTMFGISNLRAQMTMQRDSMRLSKSTIQRDSTNLPHNMHRDSNHLHGTMHRDTTRLPKNMHRDSSNKRTAMQKDSTNLLRSTNMQRDSSPMRSANMHRDSSKLSKAKKVGETGKHDMKSMNDHQGMSYDFSNWPAASRTAAEEITSKYGKPDESTSEELFWRNKGPWKKICITKDETQHSFPLEHTDMMATTINYTVPVRKMDDLGKFDGSITFDRTQGTLTARCDKEANNILALNLAHDIITGNKSAQRARIEFANIVREKMNGENPEYMQRLTFTPGSNTGDADINTTGLTKSDVSKAGMTNSSRNK